MRWLIRKGINSGNCNSCAAKLRGSNSGSFKKGDKLYLRQEIHHFGYLENKVFEMQGEGLVEVKNPAELFLEHRDEQLPGNCVSAILEGNKVLLLEVQALTSATSFGYPRRAASGFDLNRLQLLIAILQKRLAVHLNNQDVYINVAGGFSLDERAADLPVALSILSSLKDHALPAGLLAFGEIGLSGEIRGVTQVEKRLKEAEKLGFKTVLLGGRKDNGLKAKFKKLDIVSITHIKDLLLRFPETKK